MMKSSHMRLIDLNVFQYLTLLIDRPSLFGKRGFFIVAIVMAQLFTLSAVFAEDTHAIIQPTDAHEQLTEVITSSDFADVQEDKKWVRIQKPKEENPVWLIALIKKIFEFLFGDNNEVDDSHWGWLYPIIKLLLVLGLIAFIIWVLRQASVQAWFASLKNPLARKPKISTFEPALLPQSWESLPNHEHIPNAVKQLLTDNHIEQAASVLYRGSLRWLNQTHKLSIFPATTEKQCLNQMTHLSDLSKGLSKGSLAHPPKDALGVSTANYIIQIIYLWLRIAYDPEITDMSLEAPTRRDDVVLQGIKNQLMILTEQWVKCLPSNKTPILSETVSAKNGLTQSSSNIGGSQ